MSDPAAPEAVAAAIAARLAGVRSRIDAAATTAGRDPAAVRIVAVTKEFGLDVVHAARQVGLDRFGESRVQEAEPKIAALPDAEWHLVGHLQSNKVRRAVRAFDWVHSVDSAELLDRVERVASEEDRRPSVLIQVHLTDVAAQGGLIPELIPAMAAAVARLHRARAVGLMGIGPITSEAAVSRTAFARLRGLRDELEQLTGTAVPELSMGMSDDFEAAVAEGATLVRLGTALFGPRHPTESRPD